MCGPTGSYTCPRHPQLVVHDTPSPFMLLEVLKIFRDSSMRPHLGIWSSLLRCPGHCHWKQLPVSHFTQKSRFQSLPDQDGIPHCVKTTPCSMKLGSFASYRSSGTVSCYILEHCSLAQGLLFGAALHSRTCWQGV